MQVLGRLSKSTLSSFVKASNYSNYTNDWNQELKPAWCLHGFVDKNEVCTTKSSSASQMGGGCYSQCSRVILINLKVHVFFPGVGCSAAEMSSQRTCLWLPLCKRNAEEFMLLLQKFDHVSSRTWKSLEGSWPRERTGLVRDETGQEEGCSLVLKCAHCITVKAKMAIKLSLVLPLGSHWVHPICACCLFLGRTLLKLVHWLSKKKKPQAKQISTSF